mgnify:CR=1 FL=1
MGTFVRNEIAKNLAYFRKEKKLTQEDLGQQLGVKRNTVSSWESGINAIDVEVLFQICQILNVSVSDLFGKFANSSANELSVQEHTLLQHYRSLPSLGQDVVKAVIDVYNANS